MGNLIIAGFIIGVIYIGLLAVHPVHRCPQCKGRRTHAGPHGLTACRRCRATGRTYRRGAVTAHRVLREHIWPWLRERIQDRLARDDES